MAGLLLDLQPGDELIVPAFTFVSTVNAFVLRGARPVFCDIRPDTLNIDESILEGVITEKTKAIVPVHYAGVACEMDRIMAIARRHGLAVIEDNAHGLFGCYKGKNLGSFGSFATQSFHETKNVTCGEGGALLINDRQFVERAEIILEKGTNRTRFFRGQVDKYTWVDVGSSYLPSDVLAAYLLAQLQQHERIQARRCAIWNYYRNHLEGWAVRNSVRLPFVPVECAHPYHMFYVLMPSLNSRQRLMAHLAEQQIGAAFHYLPLHLSEMGKRYRSGEGGCPVTEDVSDRLLRLPLYFDLTDDDLSVVVEAICRWSV